MFINYIINNFATMEYLDYLNLFKSQGLNLYIIKDKCPAQRIGKNIVALRGWEKIIDFSKYIKQIKNSDNFGFVSGYQYGSEKYIEVLDFDIVSKTGIDDATKKLFDDFSVLDSNNKIGFFTSSTCGNYGVLLDTTNNILLRSKIEQVKAINKCKIK